MPEPSLRPPRTYTGSGDQEPGPGSNPGTPTWGAGILTAPIFLFLKETLTWFMTELHMTSENHRTVSIFPAKRLPAESSW